MYGGNDKRDKCLLIMTANPCLDIAGGEGKISTTVSFGTYHFD